MEKEVREKEEVNEDGGCEIYTHYITATGCFKSSEIMRGENEGGGGGGWCCEIYTNYLTATGCFKSSEIIRA